MIGNMRVKSNDWSLILDYDLRNIGSKFWSHLSPPGATASCLMMLPPPHASRRATDVPVKSVASKEEVIQE
jgi:hypothetical protein